VIVVTLVCNRPHVQTQAFKLTSKLPEDLMGFLDAGITRRRVVMDPNTQLQYFRKEHQDIRKFLEQFGASLTLVHSKQDDAERAWANFAMCRLTCKPYSITAIRKSGIWSPPMGHTFRHSSSRLCDRSTTSSADSLRVLSPNFSSPLQTKLTTSMVWARNWPASYASTSHTRKRY
jgi:hypothetical protein